MRKAFLFFALLFATFSFAQTAEETKQLISLLDRLKDSTSDNAKLEEIFTEADLLYKSSGSSEIKKYAKEVMNNIADFKAMNATARPLKKQFSELDKDFQKQFREDNDKFKKIEFITSKKALAWNYSLYPYISIKDNIVRMRLKTTYRGSGWLFWDNAKFIIDGKDYEYKAGSTDRNVVSGGIVTEVSDIVVNDDIRRILEMIAISPENVEYRLSGDKYRDFKLSSKEAENIKETLKLYMMLIGEI